MSAPGPLRGIPAAGAADRRLWTALAILLLVAVVLAGQAEADRLAPSGVASTGRLMGRAGFAYLTGIRTFVAAALFSRIEVIEHGYYEGRSLGQQTWAVPTEHLVVSLDPHFIQAYYVTPWILIKRGDRRGGLRLAKEGVDNNPRSGLLHASYAQILVLQHGSLAEAVRQADLALASDWVDVLDKFTGYAQLQIVYEKAGDARKLAMVTKEATRLQKLPDDQPIVNGRP